MSDDVQSIFDASRERHGIADGDIASLAVCRKLAAALASRIGLPGACEPW
jgi:hypothetical protein